MLVIDVVVGVIIIIVIISVIIMVVPESLISEGGARGRSERAEEPERRQPSVMGC